MTVLMIGPVNGKLVPVDRNTPPLIRERSSRKRSAPIRGGGEDVSDWSGQQSTEDLVHEHQDKRQRLDHRPIAPSGRGSIVSIANPKTIPGTDGKPNPFFELMPAPEVWHRRMPNVFPFGETPFMERELSRQINEDLARGKEASPAI